MPKDMSKGDDVGSPRKEENLNFLLIGNYASDADVLRHELTIITGFSYTAWYCSNLEEALIFLARRERTIAIIFVDLSIFDSCSSKERFLHVRQVFPSTPFIGLTDRTSPLLIRYVMENGITDTVSRSQIRCEPDRLRHMLGSCYELNETTKAKDNNCLAVSHIANDQGESLAKPVSTVPSALLEAVNIKLMPDSENPRLNTSMPKESPTKLRVANIKTAQQRRNLTQSGKEARGSGNFLLHQMQAQDAAMLNISKENTKLREDLRQIGLDLDDSRLKGDAILKYAQDKSAIELKSARNEIKELHKDLLRVKECLPDGYLLCPPTKE